MYDYLGCRRRSWLRSSLKASGFLRGHGDTERPPTGYSAEAAVRDLTALLDALGVDQPVHLVGNSSGATVALAMAVTHPARIAKVLLIEALVNRTPGHRPGWVDAELFPFES